MSAFSLVAAAVLGTLGAQLHLPRLWGRFGASVVGTLSLPLVLYPAHVLALDLLVASTLAVASSATWTLWPHAMVVALLGLHLLRRDRAVPLLIGAAPAVEPSVDRWSAWKTHVTRQAAERDAVEVLRGLVYREAQGVALRLDVYRPRGGDQYPSLLYLHGGGWVAGHRRLSHFLLHRFAAAGWTTFAASYRLAPRFPLPAALEDAKAAVGFIRLHGWQLGAQAGRPVVWGESAGGHLAALLALTAGEPRWQPGFEAVDTFVRGALLFYPVSDLLGTLEGDHPGLKLLLERWAVQRPITEHRQLYRGLDPMHCDVRDAPPTLLVHGTTDSLVPIAASRRFTQRLLDAGAEARLLEVPGMPHAFDLTPSPVQERVFHHALGFIDGLERSRALVRGRARR